MQDAEDYGKMLTVKDGWVQCPRCRNRRLKRVSPDEEALRVGLFCRDCKATVFVTITRGQCFESQSQ